MSCTEILLIQHCLYTKAVTHNNLICAADLPMIFVEQRLDLREYMVLYKD